MRLVLFYPVEYDQKDLYFTSSVIWLDICILARPLENNNNNNNNSFIHTERGFTKSYVI